MTKPKVTYVYDTATEDKREEYATNLSGIIKRESIIDCDSVEKKQKSGHLAVRTGKSGLGTVTLNSGRFNPTYGLLSVNDGVSPTTKAGHVHHS